jgi:hypothetical protein
MASLSFACPAVRPPQNLLVLEALITEDFCSLARRERFLSGEIYEHISSIKKRLGVARGQKDH